MKTVPKYHDGAVERGATPSPHKDLAEGAGETAPLIVNGFFQWFPHLDDLAPLGLGLIVVSTLLIIMAARTARHLDFSCRPQDRNSITGEAACRLPADVNTTQGANR